MPLISSVRIENFRSIRTLDLSGLDDYEPILGLNSAGKSNILRALKLFFTGSVDEMNTPLSMGRDYSDHARKKPRHIAVSVEFILDGPVVKYPRQEQFMTNNGLNSRLAIRQIWQTDNSTNTLTRRLQFGTSLNLLQDATPDDAPSLDSFIRSIDFRYIPNHARPADLMRTHVDPLRNVLLRRLGRTPEYRKSDGSELLVALERMSDALFSSASKGVKDGLDGISLKAALPKSFDELAFDLALQSVDGSGLARAPELEGSGAQSFMFLHVLALADSASLGSGFGWTQGAIWALEEPESFLHSNLRSRFASDLHAYATEGDRRQVFVTTHQDEFVAVGPTAILTTKGTDGTAAQQLPAAQSIKASNSIGATSYVHPLTFQRERPLVVVEGKFDSIYLKEAIRRSTSNRPNWRVVEPDQYLESGAGGDALKQYLRYNRAAIAARPPQSPLLVLRDWESNDATQYQKYLNSHASSRAAECPEALCNPELGDSFAGIERYLDTSFVTSIVPGKDLMTTGSGVIEVKRPVLEKHKPRLAGEIASWDGDLIHLSGLVDWIDRQVHEMLLAVPGDEFI